MTAPRVPSVESRILGCLLGGAIGDALGAPVEFASLAEIRERFGPEGIRDYAPAYGRLGAITDDTQMILFTAEGLLRAHVRRAERGPCRVRSVVHTAYLRWLTTQRMSATAVASVARRWNDGWLVRDERLWARRAPGNTCISALASRSSLGSFATNDSKGCGTVMRVAPVGIVRSPGAAFELGAEVSRLTHGHPTGYLAGAFLASVIANLVDGVSLREAVSAASALLGDREEASEVRAAVGAAVRLADSGEPPTAERIETLGAGWVAEEAVSIALYAGLVADDFEEGIRLAVNHSGDSDSTGAVAGDILGVMSGAEAIPCRWLDGLELRDIVEQVAADLFSLRTGTFDAEAEAERYPGS